MCICVYTSVLQCVAVCCSVLLYHAVYSQRHSDIETPTQVHMYVPYVYTCALQCAGRQHIAAMCCSVLTKTQPHRDTETCIHVFASVLQCVAVCCSVLQCVAVCCSVLTKTQPRRDTETCIRVFASVL